MTRVGTNEAQNAVRQYLELRPGSETLGLRKRVCRLEALERLRGAGRSPAQEIEFRSQYGEDCWLWELLQGQMDGFFVEVGAYDGYLASVTYAFESIGWKGLLVEPIPHQFEKARNRRIGSRVVHAALGGPGSTGTAKFSVVVTNDSGPEMLSHLTPQGPDTVARPPGSTIHQVSVPLTSMDTLLADHAGPIDVAVIDVEGNEVSVLQGFDLNRYRPRILMIEEGIPAPSSAVMQYMARFPYTPAAYVWVNRVYIRNDEPELIQRVNQLQVW